ncbi:endo-1,4-beta-xylanase [Vibrio sp. WXL103]|uniref:endo-1,4-beta-xylanase n=1 Tax=Vibrio sp. WXL103 TaxID=3450710 RepID=UPI003EC75F5D
MKRKSICLLLSTGVLLQGCLLDDAGPQSESIPEPQVASLYQLADGYPIGTALPAGDAENSLFTREDLQVLVKQHFNQITAENIMKPQYLQPSEGEFNFDDADALVGFAQDIGASVHGHTLVWHSQIPEWMQECDGATDCLTILETHIATVAGHFAGKIGSWDVVNEAFEEDGSFRNEGENGSVWYRNIGEEYIAQSFIAARAADSDAVLYYNDYNIEKNGSKLNAVLDLIADLQDKNVPIDGLGFQMHVGLVEPSLESISAALTRAADTGLKIKITELDTRLNNAGNYRVLTTELASEQQRRYQEIIKAYLKAVPSEQRGGVSVWGVSDLDSWIIDLYGNPDWPLLFTDQLKQKPAIQGFADGLLSDGNGSLPSLFHDDFSAGVAWYLDGASTASGEFAHNAQQQTMDIDINWTSESDKYVLARAFDDGLTIDFTRSRSLSFDVLTPAEFGDQAPLAIQPFIMDGTYTPAYLNYQTDYTPGEWATITISGIDPEYDFGWSGDPDFSAIDRVGLEFITNGVSVPSGTIQIDNVIIR